MKFTPTLTLLLAATLAFGAFGQAASAKKAATPSAAPAKPTAHAAAKLLDLNTAKEAELEALPAIGKVKAAAIIKARPFKGKDELVSKGILSEAQYAKLKDLVIAKQK